MESNILSIIATKVKEHRLKLNLSQERLAELSDLHPNYISLIERSKCNISVVSLKKLAKALKIEITDLLN